MWASESEDMPGLAAEAESPNLLREKPRVLIPELPQLTGCGSRPLAFCNSAFTTSTTETPLTVHRRAVPEKLRRSLDVNETANGADDKWDDKWGQPELRDLF